MRVPQPAIVIFGPTAVGKTELLVQLFPSTVAVEIINADSMQVYKYLDIGTAKPPSEIVASVPHHLVGIVEPCFQFNAGEFVHRAEKLVGEILKRGKIPVLCGGTAYYLRSFINGLPDSPPADLRIRADLKNELRERGLPALLAELERVDPLTRAGLEERDVYRIIRALEIHRSSGKPLSAFTNPSSPRSDYELLIIGLIRERNELYRRIDLRVEAMFEAGLVEEIKELLSSGFDFEDPGMRGIGYREFREMQKGCCSLMQVKELVKTNSRRYAKRQITFFKTLPGVLWQSPEEVDQLRARSERFIAAHLGAR